MENNFQVDMENSKIVEKVKKSIIKSSTLRRLNIINPKHDGNFMGKGVVFNKKKKAGTKRFHISTKQDGIGCELQYETGFTTVAGIQSMPKSCFVFQVLRYEYVASKSSPLKFE